MSHQDWNQVVWKKSTVKSVLPQRSAGSKQFKTLNEATDAVKITKIPREVAQKLQQGRLEKKLKQNELANRINMPVKTIQDIELMLNSGADKVSINSAAIDDINFIYEAAKKFGSSTIVTNIETIKIYSNI